MECRRDLGVDIYCTDRRNVIETEGLIRCHRWEEYGKDAGVGKMGQM
jgi:hypothetical protein